MARRNKSAILLNGIGKVEARLKRVAETTTDLEPVWGTLGQLWANRQRAVFATNGLGRWAPVSRPALLDGSARPLVDEGTMREGLTQQMPRFARKRFVAYGPTKYDRRVMNPAVFHANGTRRMPARPPVPKMTAAEKKQWVRLIDRYVTRQATR